MVREILIPEDVLESEILTRLPVKSLLRFKCVCKSWHTIINNPNFISAHRIFHQNNHSCFLMKSAIDPYEWTFLSYKTLQLDSGFYYPVDFVDDDRHPRLFGSLSVNGIFCLSVHISTTHINSYLLNPATRELMKLPPPDSLSLPEDYTFDYEGFGFGYDPILDDYKVVQTLRISIAFDHHIFSENDYPFAVVYNLGTNCWRRLYSKKYWCVMQDGGVFINGMFHWLAQDQGRQLLLSFDMSTELFCPTYMLGHNHPKLMFNVYYLNESISVIVLDTSQPFLERSIEVWILGEIGVEKSWTKRFTIDPLGVPYPNGVGKNGEIFFVRESVMACYDLNTGMVRNLDFEADPSCARVATYSESLVPLRGRINHHAN